MSDECVISCHILMCIFQSWVLESTPSCRKSRRTTISFTKTNPPNAIFRPIPDQPLSSKFDISDSFVHLGSQGMSYMDLHANVLQNFPSLCKTLFSPGEPIQSLDGLVYTNTRKPDIFICDMFRLDLCNIFRSLPGCNAPILTWVSPGTTGVMRITGPEVLRGLGDVQAQAELLAAENDRMPSEIELEALYLLGLNIIHDHGLKYIDIRYYGAVNGELILHMFGGVDMYDYELFPQGHNVDPSFRRRVHVFNQAYRMIMDTDGLLFASNVVFEPEVHEACRKWCAERGKSCYVVGPFAYDDDQLETLKHRSDRKTAKLEHFLDRIYASHVVIWDDIFPRSTNFITSSQTHFGNEDTALQVMAHVPARERHGEIPPELRAELDKSDKVYISEWTPQELILYHKATGWFMTHWTRRNIGSSHTRLPSVRFHSMSSIAWPIYGEQPYNAAFCTLKLDIAYELYEVRTVEGLKPLYRGVRPTGTGEAIIEEARTVLTKAFGEDGKQKRRNAEQLRDRVRALWKDGGDSLTDMRRFIADYVVKDIH